VEELAVEEGGQADLKGDGGTASVVHHDGHFNALNFGQLLFEQYCFSKFSQFKT
jgi:hypothetical protein